MADIISTIAAIGSILKALGSTGFYFRSVSNSAKEVQLVTKQVHATEAVLKSLKTSLQASPPSSSIHAIWADSTNLVLSNAKEIIDDLNTKFSSQRGIVAMTFRKKMMWPLDKEDSSTLLAHLKSYIHMLNISQTALTSGNVRIVQRSVQEIDDILTRVGSRCPSTIVRSNPKTITPGDSVSQISVQVSESRSSLFTKAIGFWRQRGLSDEHDPSGKRKTKQKRLQKAWVPHSTWEPPGYLNTYEASIELSSIRFYRRGSQATRPQELGGGSLTLTIPQDGSKICGFYRLPSSTTPYEWQLNPQNPGMDIITNDFATFRWTTSGPGPESTEETLTLTFYKAYGEPANESKLQFLSMMNKLCEEAKKVQGLSARQRRKAASLQSYSRQPNYHQLGPPDIYASCPRRFLTDTESLGSFGPSSASTAMYSVRQRRAYD